MTERFAGLPQSFLDMVQGLGMAPKAIKMELLLEYAKKMPTLPEGKSEQLEQVHECTTPFFVHVEFDEHNRVRPFFDAPAEAPTVRAFAGMLAEGLTGATPDQVLAVPEDFYLEAKLGEIVTPLRLRGLQAVLGRMKRQVREATGLV